MITWHTIAEIPKWVWLLSLIFFLLGVLSGYDLRGSIAKKRLLRRARQLRAAAVKSRSEMTNEEWFTAQKARGYTEFATAPNIRLAVRFEETASELERLAK